MSKTNPCDGTCNIYVSELVLITRAAKKLLDTLPPDADAYYGHWDSGSEATDEAIKNLRELINYPDKRQSHG